MERESERERVILLHVKYYGTVIILFLQVNRYFYVTFHCQLANIKVK